MRVSFAVESDIRQLAANVKAARLRRRIPQTVVAERADISVNTLSKLENGDPGIAIGNLASVLHALGFESPLSMIAAPDSDPEGLMLEEQRLPKRIRRKKKSS